jgi:hypothetical protein
MRSDHDIIVPEHPRWSEFLSSLSQARICFGTTDQARRVLESMPGVDVEGTLIELAERGGTCDCQVEHDVAPLRREA